MRYDIHICSAYVKPCARNNEHLVLWELKFVWSYRDLHSLFKLEWIAFCRNLTSLVFLWSWQWVWYETHICPAYVKPCERKNCEHLVLWGIEIYSILPRSTLAVSSEMNCILPLTNLFGISIELAMSVICNSHLSRICETMRAKKLRASSALGSWNLFDSTAVYTRCFFVSVVVYVT